VRRRDGVSAVLGRAAEVGGLTFRQRGVLVAATASTLGDSYCALAWGTRLAGEVGDDVAAAVLAGDDAGLDPSDAALARWARKVATDPNGTTAADVEALRAAGFDDAQILAVTVFVAGRLAFSTVNDALGARPDAELVDRAPGPVRRAVTFGRPADGPAT
jgi:alkylhydroperoxidase family enzyme